MANTNRRQMSEGARKTLVALVGAHITEEKESKGPKIASAFKKRYFSSGQIYESGNHFKDKEEVCHGLRELENLGYLNLIDAYFAGNGHSKSRVQTIYRIKPERLNKAKEIVGGIWELQNGFG